MRIPASVALFALAAAACQRAPERPNDPEHCATCHMDEFRSAKNPVHVGTRPDTCAICHTQSSWHPSVNAHPWPLTGAHAKATCYECHSNPPKFVGMPKQCIGCHRADYNKAPNHVAQKFPTKCEQCHQTTSWSNPTGGPPPVPTVPATAPPPASASAPKGKPTGPQPPPKPKPAPTPTTPPDVTTHASPRR
jgi:Cytochrome c7 and related cytochrome c